MTANVVHRSWLCRVIEFPLDDGYHVLMYNGTGFGYEEVAVDATVVSRRSWFWFVPRFEFNVGDRRGTVEVRVWSWLSLRSLVVRLDDQILYAEGVEPEAPVVIRNTTTSWAGTNQEIWRSSGRGH